MILYPRLSIQSIIFMKQQRQKAASQNYKKGDQSNFSKSHIYESRSEKFKESQKSEKEFDFQYQSTVILDKSLPGQKENYTQLIEKFKSMEPIVAQAQESIKKLKEENKKVRESQQAAYAEYRAKAEDYQSQCQNVQEIKVKIKQLNKEEPNEENKRQIEELKMLLEQAKGNKIDLEKEASHARQLYKITLKHMKDTEKQHQKQISYQKQKIKAYQQLKKEIKKKKKKLKEQQEFNNYIQLLPIQRSCPLL